MVKSLDTLGQKHSFRIFLSLLESPKGIDEIMGSVFQDQAIEVKRVRVACTKCNYENEKKADIAIQVYFENKSSGKKSNSPKFNHKCSSCRKRILGKNDILKRKGKLVSVRILDKKDFQSKHSSFMKQVRPLITSKLVFVTHKKYNINYKAALIKLYQSMPHEWEKLYRDIPFGLVIKHLISNSSELLDDEKILKWIFIAPLHSASYNPNTFQEYFSQIALSLSTFNPKEFEKSIRQSLNWSDRKIYQLSSLVRCCYDEHNKISQDMKQKMSINWQNLFYYQ